MPRWEDPLARQQGGSAGLAKAAYGLLIFGAFLAFGLLVVFIAPRNRARADLKIYGWLMVAFSGCFVVFLLLILIGIAAGIH